MTSLTGWRCIGLSAVAVETNVNLAFDARPWEKPPHSLRRVVSLLVHTAETMGWEFELWNTGPLQPEFAAFAGRSRPWSEAPAATRAVALWSADFPRLTLPLPVVTTIHDVNPLLPDRRHALARAWRAFRFRRKAAGALAASRRVVTCSIDAQGRLAAEFPAQAAKLMVVPYFVEPALRRPDTSARDAVLAQLGLKPGYILFFASLRRHKNWDGLMRAYALLPEVLRREHPLVLAGSYRRVEQDVRRLAEELGIVEQLRLPGSIPEAGVPALYAGAFLFAFPSFMEGFGLPPLEAMACEVPVIASHRTSIPEVLGDAPLYCDPAQPETMAAALARAAQDAALRTRLIEAGLRRVTRFTPRNTGAAMQAVLAALT